MELTVTKRSDPRLLACMTEHYSRPEGFVGRNICYSVSHDGTYYGHIVGGSATLHLIGRNEFFDPHIHAGEFCHDGCGLDLKRIVNNIFFHISPPKGKYPFRNFAQTVLARWRSLVAADWQTKYGDEVKGFESLVELPRPGTVYLRDGWTYVGTTKGFTCKRKAGKGTDSWSGKRVWNTKELRPKLVFVRMAILVLALSLTACTHRQTPRACVLPQAAYAPQGDSSPTPASAGIVWAQQNGVDVCHMHGGEK